MKQWQTEVQVYIELMSFRISTRVQYDVIRMLALPEDNLFVVGDDDQAIYGFRGRRRRTDVPLSGRLSRGRADPAGIRIIGLSGKYCEEFSESDPA